MNDDPIALLERELLAAARRQVGGDRRARPVTHLAGGLANAGLVAITVSIAIGAILLLGNGHRSGLAGGSSAGGSQQQLLQTLGVLRTRPSAADRAVIACSERFAMHSSGAGCAQAIPPIVRAGERTGHPRWNLGLIRTVPLHRIGLSVRLFPGTWQSSTSQRSKQQTAGILAAFVYRASAYPFFVRTTVATLRAHGLALMIGAGVPKPPADYIHLRAENWGGIVVPDGVAKITVGVVRLVGQPSVHWFQNVSAAVHDNVASVQLNTPTFPVQLNLSTLRTTGFTSLAARDALADVTWLDAHGRIVRHTTTTMKLFVYFQLIRPRRTSHSSTRSQSGARAI